MCRRTTKPSVSCVFGAVYALLLAAPAARAAEASPTPAQRREQLLPVYQSMRHDAVIDSLRSQMESAPADARRLDAYLLAIPLSPLDFREIDMWQNHYEIVIPRAVMEQHQRWVELHPELARLYYGRAAADAILLEEEATREMVAKIATVGGNHEGLATAYQGEVQVVANPKNPLQVVAATNTWDTGGCAYDTQAIFYSSDAGATWQYTCAPTDTGYSLGSCASSTKFGSDPALSWDDQNNVFLNYMLICDTTNPTRVAMVVAKSTDGGAHWAAQGVIRNGWAGNTFEDKNFYTIDTTLTSPYHGRHYTCWDRSNNEKFAYSSNGGSTWTEVDLPAPSPAVTYDLGCDLAVTRDGHIHVVFDTLTCPSSCTAEQMYYTRSTDGGATWSAPVQVGNFHLVFGATAGANCATAQDERCIGPFGALAVDNSGGPCDGNLYVVYSDWTSGGVDATQVWLTRSLDHGATWLTPVRVNNDATNSHFNATVQVEQGTGRPVIAWHDTRADVTKAKVEIYLADSNDCGASIAENVRVSQPSNEFNNSSISYLDENHLQNVNYNSNQYGEYLGLSVVAARAYVGWSDGRMFFPANTSDPSRENLGFATVELGLFLNGFESGDTAFWSAHVP